MPAAQLEVWLDAGDGKGQAAHSRQMPATQLEVWLDAGIVDTAIRVGNLYNDRGQIRFEYDKAWLAHPHAFALDPALGLDGGAFFPRAEDGNFGIFLDSCPDRWGQTLMRRREALDAKDARRAPKTLHAWDFLLGVQDDTRQGALRFCDPADGVFQAAHSLPAPPVTSLRELEAIALELTAKKIDNLSALRKWLAVLVAPGASLGGARPKANYTEADGSLWIAKFPSREDDRDVGAWEWVVHQLAVKARIAVPRAKCLRFNNPYHTFCVQRFDRADGRRVFYASAMTLLGASQSEGKSYLDIAEFMQKHGAGQSQINQDLEQLFRRVAFNVAVGNRDDHLRNHGFVLTRQGWALSMAFDVNPAIDKATHVLNLDESDNRPNMNSVLNTATYYGLEPARAKKIIGEILRVTSTWRVVAKTAGISRADIELTAAAFEGEHLRV